MLPVRFAEGVCDLFSGVLQPHICDATVHVGGTEQQNTQNC